MGVVVSLAFRDDDEEIRAIEAQLLARHTSRFVGRQWLIRDIEGALEVPDCRIILLTGNAGIGKSSVLAEIARRRPEAFTFFLRRDSIHALRSGDARSFLLDFGFRLADARPELFTRDREKIDVGQDASEVDEKGEMVGVRVARMAASPFEQVAIEVRQRVGRVAGRVAGIVIEEYVAEARRLTVDDLLEMAVRRPLARLAAESPDQRIVVLLDALDEVMLRRDGASNPADLIDLLADVHHFPSNLRLVVTSRKGTHLAPLLELDHVQHLELLQDQPENIADLETYVTESLKTISVVATGHLKKFRERILHKAAGNFLYASMILRTLVHATEEDYDRDPLAFLETLPPDLAGVYAALLRRTIPTIERKYDRVTWAESLHPILSVLAVARRPVSIPELATLTAISAVRTTSLLSDLAAFLDVREDNGIQARLFHVTFGEYLISANDAMYRVDVKETVRSMRQAALLSWGGMEADLPLLRPGQPGSTYAVSHLPRHLLQIGDTREAVDLLIAPRYFEPRVLLGEAFSHLEDLRAALTTPGAAFDIARALENFLAEHVNWIVRHHAAALAQFVDWATSESSRAPELREYVEKRLVPLFVSSGRRGLFRVGARPSMRGGKIPPSAAQVYSRKLGAAMPDGRVLFGSNTAIEMLEPGGRITVVPVTVKGLLEGIHAISNREIVIVKYGDHSAGIIRFDLVDQTSHEVAEIDLEYDEFVRGSGMVGGAIRIVTGKGRVATVPLSDEEEEFDEEWLEIDDDDTIITAAWVDPDGSLLIGTQQKEDDGSLSRIYPQRDIWQWNPADRKLASLATLKGGTARLALLAMIMKTGRIGETVAGNQMLPIDAICRLKDGTILVARGPDLLRLQDRLLRRIVLHDESIDFILQDAAGRVFVLGHSTAIIDLGTKKRVLSVGQTAAMGLLPDDQLLTFDSAGPRSVFDPFTGRRVPLGLPVSNGFAVQSAAITNGGLIGMTSMLDGKAIAMSPAVVTIGWTATRVRSVRIAPWDDEEFIFPVRDEENLKEHRLQTWNPATGELTDVSEPFLMEAIVGAAMRGGELVLVEESGEVWTFSRNDRLPRRSVTLQDFDTIPLGSSFGLLPHGGFVACDPFGTLRAWGPDGSVVATYALNGTPTALASSPRSGLITIADADDLLHSFSMRSQPAAPADESREGPRSDWRPPFSSRLARGQALSRILRATRSTWFWFSLFSLLYHWRMLKDAEGCGGTFVTFGLIVLRALPWAALWNAVKVLLSTVSIFLYRNMLARNRTGRVVAPAVSS
jgi:hypothetical protein